jgi:sugar/nucleoside kinase (ribokinase family)
MSPRWDVLGFGAVAVDDLFYVDHHPAPDSKLPVRATQRVGGGLAGTALVAAARLSATAAFCGVLGDDELSQFTIHELERERVDCTPVLRRAEAGPFHSVVIVDQTTGQRCILFDGRSVMEVPAECITSDLIADCRVLFVDWTTITSGLVACELAHRHDIPVVADLEANQDPRLPELVRQVDHLVIGVEMAQSLTGESEPAAAVRVLSAAGRAANVVTAGAQGCWYAERDGAVQHVPALEVEVVDTTGCGDVFHGAYAASLARGESVSRAVRVATIAAGLKATQPGGRAGIPDRATVDSYLNHWKWQGES